MPDTQSNEDNISKSNVTFTQGENSYIPYSCHYNDNTVLTKNGELLQTFKIVGLGADNPSDLLLELRRRVREALNDNIDTQNISIWIHTMRRSANLVKESHTSYRLAEIANEYWREKNYWRDKFVNDLYITVLHRSVDFNYNSLRGFLKSLSFKVLKQSYSQYLAQSHDILNSYVNSIMEQLSDFEPHKLGVYFEHQEVYSENITFFNRLLHFWEIKLPLPVKDISEMLSLHKIAAGTDTIEVIYQGEKRFAKIISLKHYQELPQEVLAKVLQLPFEYYISETVEFIPQSEAKEAFKDYSFITGISEDSDIREATDLTEFTEPTQQGETKYCKRQFSITVFADNIANLNKNIKKLSETINSIGLINVLEDIDMEAVYWSQLPGNFSFIKRTHEGLSKYIASFSSLHTSPLGSKSSVWGNFITILRTADATAYFFNFHSKSNGKGHTLVSGAANNGKTTLQNFLTSQAMYKNPNLLYITSNQDNHSFLRLLGGEWRDIGDEFAANLNPCLLENTEENRDFLYNFILSIVRTKQDASINSSEQKDLFYEKNDFSEATKHIVQSIMQEKPENRKLSKLPELYDFEYNDLTKELYGYLKPWIEEERYQGVLQSENENFDLSNSLLGLDLSTLTKSTFREQNFPSMENLIPQYYKNEFNNEIYRTHLLYYLLYRYLTEKQNNEPTIIVLDELFALINDNCIEVLNSLFELAEAKNCMFLISANGFEFEKDKDGSHLVEFYNMFDTQFLLCNEDIQRERFSDFNMSDEEIKAVKSLKPLYRNFVLRQDSNSIRAEVNLSISQPLLKILSEGGKYIGDIEGLISRGENDLNKITDKLMDRLKEN
jgi:type IV secretion system protein VirB4